MRILREKGFGTVEAMIAATMILGLAVGISYWGSNNQRQSRDLRSVSSCDALASDIVSSLKSESNGLNVRNWLPTAQTAIGSAVDANDSYCNVVGGRTAVCDATPLFMRQPGSNYVDLTKFLNFQNIRGAVTWAQHIYNASGEPICTGGIDFPNGTFGNLLPVQTSLPDWVSKVNLYIKDETVQCGTLSESYNAKFNVQIKVSRVRLDRGLAGVEDCMKSLELAFPRDNLAPNLSTKVINGYGDLVGDGKCSYTKSVDDLNNEGGAPPISPKYRDLKITVTGNEPGLLFLCRRTSAFESDPPGSYWNCPDMVVGNGAVSVTPNDASPTFNTPGVATVEVSGLLDRGVVPYSFEVQGVDVAGNRSPSSTPSFEVKYPICIDKNLYCPNAVKPVVPNAAFAGIMVRPWDDCFNDQCPQGTHSGCDAAQAPNFCVGQFYNDDCGLPKCAGTKACGPGPGPGPACVPAICTNPNTFCGAPAPADDGCGTACPVGVACVGPGCVPTGVCVDPNNFCGAPVPADDGCGQACPAGVNCGPGPGPGPGPGCVPVACTDPNNFCGAPVPADDGCGQVCPVGVNCGPGPGPGPGAGNGCVPVACTDPNNFCGAPAPADDGCGQPCPVGVNCGPGPGPGGCFADSDCPGDLHRPPTALEKACSCPGAPDVTYGWCPVPGGACASDVTTQQCFIAGTPIAMADGTVKAIEEVEVGDQVSSARPEVYLTQEKHAVLETYIRYFEGDIYHLTFSNGSQLIVTPDHKIWAQTEESITFKWLKVRDLHVGALMLTARPGEELSPVEVQNIETIPYRGPVYNFHVDFAKTYFANDILVHNCSACP